MTQTPNNACCESQPVARVQWVPREQLRANNYNPNNVAPIELALLALSIIEDGWTQPIVTREAEEEGESASEMLEIVDGFHRWTVSGRSNVAALTNGLVPVVILPREKSRSDRMLSTIRHNRARGEHGVRPMGAIVRELLESGMSEEELAKRCGMEREEIDRLSDLSGMPQQVAKRLESKGGEGKAPTGFNKGFKPDA